nr:hypothetical protein [Tanacetum cinerariifolium]
MVFFYFSFSILASTTLRRKGDPIMLCIAPRLCDRFCPSACSNTCFSSLEVLEGLILNIPRAITLSLFTPLDSCGVETKFEVTGFDKAFVLLILGRFSTIGCFANLVFLLVKNDTICNEKASNVFRKEREQYLEIQDLKAQLQDKNISISELKKLIEEGKGKSMDTKFDRPSVVRQPNAQRIPKPSVLGKPKPFSNSLDRIYFQKTKSVSKANVSEGLPKPVTAQTLPQTAKEAV